MKNIPIIILNWNGLDDTLECIPSVLAQSYPNFHIYLVDNGSRPEQVQPLIEIYGAQDKLTLIQNQENQGFTRGNNVIMKKLLAEDPDLEYIALLNNDTKVHEDWLQELVNCAKSQQASIVSSKMINYFYPHIMDNAGHKMLNTGEILPIAHAEPIERYETSFENIGSCAGATLYEAAMLRKIGIFDEYFNTGYEDAELGLRATVTGYKCVFAPKAIVWHKVSQSINKIRDFKYTLKIQVDIFYTCLKLLPTTVLIIHFIPFVMKILMVLVIDVVFRRWKFLKVMLYAFYEILVTDRKIIAANRRKFYQQHQAISSFKIMKHLEFFLLFDIRRFKKYIIEGETMVFEKYD